MAWKASDNFEAILKTDLDKLTRLVHCYSQSDIDINHELRLLKIESKYAYLSTLVINQTKFNLEFLMHCWLITNESMVYKCCQFVKDINQNFKCGLAVHKIINIKLT